MSDNYIYELKTSLITQTERSYFEAIEKILPNQYFLQPQINLRTIIEKTNNSKYANELYRNIDAGIFEKGTFKPVILIEINDNSHNRPDRIERDKKVKMICEEAGIPLVVFWTKFGINNDYIKQRVLEAIEQSKNPVRVAHSLNSNTKNDYQSKNQSEYKLPDKPDKNNTVQNNNSNSKSGCYIATCVYGSYDCPEVWTLRRYRDKKLANTYFGRMFIRIYYAISPKLVKFFGNTKWFKRFWKNKLDHTVKKLQDKGFENTPYKDYNR